MPPVLVAILVGLGVSQLALLDTSVFLHRSLAHRSLTLSPWAAFVARTLLWITTGIQPREWVAVHRKHHAYSDVPGDPHSPVLEGLLTVQFANVVLYRRAARDTTMVARYARDLAPDRFDRALFDHALPGLAIGAGALVALLGWEMALVAGAVHIAFYLLASSTVNALGHAWGRRPYTNQATNNQWLAWLVVGEGLHNNHHAAPTSARFSLAPGQTDLGWWVICALRRCGWATVRHTEVKLKVAREIRKGTWGQRSAGVLAPNTGADLDLHLERPPGRTQPAQSDHPAGTRGFPMSSLPAARNRQR